MNGTSFSFSLTIFNISLNPISAGVIENQDMMGGGQFDPPPSPLNPMFDVQI